MLRIGLTGGIAAGKSTASARFAELGARIIDHDALARQVVAPGTAGLVDVVAAFGGGVVKDGDLDRQALAAIVFADPVARERLNGIIHPYVLTAAQAADRQAREDGVAVVVHDIPLLIETGQAGSFELLVCVAAPEEVRIARLINSRGLSRRDALGRIGAQAGDDDRSAACDVTLDGSGTPDQLREQVDAFWDAYVPQ